MDIGLPEVMLFVGGFLSILIVHMYRKDKDAGSYKALMILGFIAGVVMIALTGTNYSNWPFFDSLLIILAGFALVIRPFRETDLAIIIAVVVMVVTYVFLGTLTGDFAFLAETYPRIIVSVIAGAFAFMILNFLEKLAMLIGKILNLWPILLVLGLICLVEGILIVAGGKTVYDYIQEYTKVIAMLI